MVRGKVTIPLLFIRGPTGRRVEVPGGTALLISKHDAAAKKMFQGDAIMIIKQLISITYATFLILE
jgi:hypothetical protein